MKVEKQITSFWRTVNAKGKPNIFYKSYSFVIDEFVPGSIAKMNYKPYMIRQHSVAPIYNPPPTSTTVAWNWVKCFLYSIVKCGRSYPFTTIAIGQNLSPVLDMLNPWITKNEWLNWSRLWSKSYPSGLQLSVARACFPSMASSVWYQNIPSPFIIKTDAGRTSVIVTSYVHIYKKAITGTMIPQHVIMFGETV